MTDSSKACDRPEPSPEAMEAAREICDTMPRETVRPTCEDFAAIIDRAFAEKLKSLKRRKKPNLCFLNKSQTSGDPRPSNSRETTLGPEADGCGTRQLPRAPGW